MVAHEVQRVRDAARSLPLYDERRAGELREKCLALSDVRAILVEVVGEHDLAQHAAGLRAAKRQSLALRVRPAWPAPPCLCTCAGLCVCVSDTVYAATSWL